jgi:regulator-associated protein of mTOR
MSNIFDGSSDADGKEHEHSAFFDSYPWHSHKLLDASMPGEEASNTWRLKRKTNTVGVALVVCLNVGTDPPDVFKPQNCARKECWFDPVSVPKNKALETIGNALQRQYEKWQAKAKYKQCLDPTSEDLRRVCINLRKATRSDRLLLHYNGHGVPKPTDNGELWVFGKHYSHYMPVAVSEVRSWLGDPSIYVLDCSGAGALIPYFIEDQQSPTSASLPSPTEPPSPKSRSFQTMEAGMLLRWHSQISSLTHGYLCPR